MPFFFPLLQNAWITFINERKQKWRRERTHDPIDVKVDWEQNDALQKKANANPKEHFVEKKKKNTNRTR